MATDKAHKLDETRHLPVRSRNGAQTVTLFDGFSGRRLHRKAKTPAVT